MNNNTDWALVFSEGIVNTLEGVELIAVIELEPWGFSNRRTPEGGIEPHGPVTREKWNEYCQLCFKDAGLDQLSPITPNSTFFAVSQFQEPAVLAAVAQREFDLWATDDVLPINEQIVEFGSCLYGGVAILNGAEVITQPGCCSGLDSLHEWSRVAATAPSTWTDIWVGHDVDSIEVLFDSSEQVFRFRLAPWMTSQWDREFAISTSQFKTQLDQMLAETTSMSHRLVETVPKQLETNEVRELAARCMAGVLDQ